MYQYKGFEDTIAAIVTAPGIGGIGVVRVSGASALAIADKIFLAKNAGGKWRSFTVRYGWIKEVDGSIVDEALVTFMRGPKSYTCEDVIEISLHGGGTVVRAVLELCLKNGARLSEPGEFTKRAFLNGRIDLAQAEAVLDIITARTEAFLRTSTHQLKGELSTELESIRTALLETYAGIEALINFPEEDTDKGQDVQVKNGLNRASERIGKLLATSQSGRILREGIKVVICGKPNVGKSSLLNALLKTPRAIVTDVAGTTRDVLEEAANINGIPINLVDTAGILVPRDKVEEEAVKRSRLSIESADIVLFVVDQSVPLEKMDHELIGSMKNPHVIVVVNKSDLSSAFKALEVFKGQKLAFVSALHKKGLEELQSLMVETVLDGKHLDTHAMMLTNVRHIDALRRAQASLAKAGLAIEDKNSLEFISEDIKLAINELDAITGRNVDQDALDEIFARFCIGK